MTGKAEARKRLLTPLTDEEAKDLVFVTKADIDASLREADRWLWCQPLRVTGMRYLAPVLRRST